MDKNGVVILGVFVADLAFRARRLPAIGETIADSKDEIGFQKGRIAVAMARLQPHHSGHQRMIVRDRSPTHQCRDYGNAGQFGKLKTRVGMK